MKSEEKCRICGVPTRDEHLRLEEERIINHQFSSDGKVNPVDRRPKAQSRRQEVMVVPGVDIALRSLLIKKGLLSESDFIDAGAYGAGLGGDSQDRPAEGTSGGMRAPAGDPVPEQSGSDDGGTRGTEPESETE